MKYLHPYKYNDLITFLAIGLEKNTGASEDDAINEVVSQLNSGKNVRGIVDDIFKFSGKPTPDKLPDDIEEILAELES